MPHRHLFFDIVGCGYEVKSFAPLDAGLDKAELHLCLATDVVAEELEQLFPVAVTSDLEIVITVFAVLDIPVFFNRPSLKLQKLFIALSVSYYISFFIHILNPVRLLIFPVILDHISELINFPQIHPGRVD